jgi:hypothetical protein
MNLGTLIAEIDGSQFLFDGNHWTGPDAQLVARLDAWTKRTPKTHGTIREIGQEVLWELNRFGRRWEILSVDVPEKIPAELPPGDID